MDILVKKKKRPEISDLCFYLKKLEKEQIKTTVRYFLPMILAEIQKFDRLSEAMGKLALLFIHCWWKGKVE